MIKLLIADDEEEIRKGIRHMIDWHNNGIEVCGEAGDGSQALMSIDRMRPDIVLMDIRMPEMSGLEVAEVVYQRKYPTKSIILSGYDDFSFARQALKSGVSDYLLKPCLPEEILHTVLKVKGEIEHSWSEKRQQLSLQAKLDESLPLLREKQMIAWLRAESDEALPDHSGLFDFFRLGCRAMTVLIRIDDEEYFSSLPLHTGTDDSAARLPAIRAAVEALLPEVQHGEIVDDRTDLILLATLLRGQEEIWLRKLAELQDRLRRTAGFSITIGVGRLYDQASGFRHSYKEALLAAQGRFLAGPGSLLHPVVESADDSLQSPAYPSAEAKTILNAVKAGHASSLGKQVEAYFNALQPDHGAQERVSRCCMALLMSLRELCVELHLDPEPIAGLRLASIDRVLRMQTLQQMKDAVMQAATAISAKISDKRGGSRVVELAVAYIHEHYDRELTLELLSSRLFVNPNYFCQLFKQHMEVNFVDYLHQIRIEKACELLRTFPYKTYEVASKVGYVNEKYFSRIFKQRTGMTPTQYRDSTG